MTKISQKVAKMAIQSAGITLLPLMISSTVQAAVFKKNQVVVTNRASGTLSVIDPIRDTATTIDIPFEPIIGESPPDPMYVFHIRSTNEVVVGDRANNRLVFFDQVTYQVTGTAPAGNGVFHMWGASDDSQLWVNNENDKTITVINPVNKTRITTIDIPADLAKEEGKPHDVILGPSGEFAYVSVLNLSEDHVPDPECPPGCDVTSVVLQYSTDTFEEVARADVGVDPHFGLTNQNNYLYVAAEQSNLVNVLNRSDLSFVTSIDVPGAHGAGVAGGATPNGRFFYTTNFPSSDGSNGLFIIDTMNNQLIGSDFDTGFARPHNIAVTNDNKKLYISHSTSDLDPGKVTVYDLDSRTGLPTGSTPTRDINVGVNPFGIFFVSQAVSVPESSSLPSLLFFASLLVGSVLKSNKINQIN